MNSDRAACILADVQKVAHDSIGWIAAVEEDEIGVHDAVGGELSGVVGTAIESDDIGDILLAEVDEILLEGLAGGQIGLRVAECNDFARDNPVEIAVLNLLVVMIILHIECLKIEQLEHHRFLNCTQTIFEVNVMLTLVEASMHKGNETFHCQVTRGDINQSTHHLRGRKLLVYYLQIVKRNN